MTDQELEQIMMQYYSLIDSWERKKAKEFLAKQMKI